MTSLEFVSSRGGSPAVTLSEAIRQGLAPDGGLYIPSRLPSIDVRSCVGLTRLPELARATLGGFFAGDPLQSRLGEIADAAIELAAPVTPVTAGEQRLFALELFHGPTAAFKDFGARFLAESLQRLESGSPQPLTILVATSGDTGGAVAAAFHLRPWVRVVILYPKGLVSPRQEQQLTCWGDNVISLRIDGTFDDCQRLVKEAFVDFALCVKHRFSSANSINIGRLLPQMLYYMASSLELSSAPLRNPPISSRPATWAMPLPPSGRAHSDFRSLVSSSRTTPTAPFRTTCAPVSGCPVRAYRRWPRRWTSAIRAIWSAFARSIPPRTRYANN